MYGRARPSLSVTVGVTDDGKVYFRDADGNPLPEHLVDIAKREQGDAIRSLIQKKCDEINAPIEALGKIHFYTPSPSLSPQYKPHEYQVPPPMKPMPRNMGLLGTLFKAQRERIEIENAEKEREYVKALTEWCVEKERFDKAERHRKELIEQGIYTDVDAMEDFLEQTLQCIVWPRETTVSTEILDGGKRVFVDVDLPEIEDMPTKTASAPQRGYRLSVKEMSVTQIQRLYMRHVHSIGFRIIGETFAALPNAQEVVLSAFSQRPDRATAHVADEYLYSVRVDRNAWSRINFGNLQNMDVEETFAQFELRRNMTKAGSFKAVEPFEPNS